MKYVKLGNTIFQQKLILGATKVPTPQEMNKDYKFRVIIFLDNVSLKSVSFPTKTEEDADAIIAATLHPDLDMEKEHVIDLEAFAKI